MLASMSISELPAGGVSVCAHGIGLPLDRLVIDDAAELCRAERLTGSSRRRSRRPSDAELVQLHDWFCAPRLSAQSHGTIAPGDTLSSQ